uniref:G_PROTEIN_RECEP_F1_2 domain-containing protein n=1 Tax=Heterorhabditis bacteriophora TaxID=37862 RepID=A0A1I7XMW4_HETBA
MNETNETTVAEHPTIGETAFYLSSGAIGSVFNALVLWIALRYIDTDDKPRQIIVINMTAADLLMCMVYMLTRPYLSYFPIFSCHPYYVTIWTVQLVSCLNLVWLNVDKLIFIQFPLHYYSIVNRKKMLIVAAVTWLLLGYLAVMLDSFLTVSVGCGTSELSPYIYLPMCILYLVMILTSFIISAVIYFIAHTSTRMEARQRTKLFHRLFFLFSSTLWTFFTCLPYRALYLMHKLRKNSDSEFLDEVTNIFFRILVVGTVINPLITIWTQRIYRMRLLKAFNKWQESSTSEDTAVTVNTRRPSSKAITTFEGTPFTTSL